MSNCKYCSFTEQSGNESSYMDKNLIDSVIDLKIATPRIRSGIWMDDGDFYLYVHINDNYEDGEWYSKKIKFCPICGRKLRQQMSKISKEKRHQIYMLRLACMPLKGIREETGASISTIRKIFKDESILSHVKIGDRITLRGKNCYELSCNLDKGGFKYSIDFKGEKPVYTIYARDITKECFGLLEEGSR